MIMNKVINTCIIDTVYGSKSINLVNENITKSNDDLIIFFYNKSLKDLVFNDTYNLLKTKYKLNYNTKKINSFLINGVSLRCFNENYINRNVGFLLVKTLKEKNNKIKEYENLYKSIFAFLKALEFNDIYYKNISIVIEDNDKLQHFDIIKLILQNAIKYLKESKNSDTINIFINKNEDKWNKAFEKTLGRTYYKQGSLDIIETLKNNLMETIEVIYKSGKFKELEFVLNIIYGELEEVDSLSINNIAINSRKISEIIAKEIAGRKNISIKKIKHDLSAILNLLASKDIVAPWVIQYLHTARVFGNKSAHVETAIKYEPNKLYTDDFISILSTLYNILWFWYYNKEKI